MFPLILEKKQRRRRGKRREEGEGERKRTINVRQRNMDWLPTVYAHTGDRSCNLCMCPEWASNPRPFDVQMRLQPAEPYHPGLWGILEYNVYGGLINVPSTPLQLFMDNFIDLILSL